MVAMSKAGAAGQIKAGEANQLQAAMLESLLQVSRSAEQGARAALDTDDMEGADVCIAEIWKASRLAAVAKGRVDPDAGGKQLVDAERRQAREQASLVVSLSNEIAGTREQVKAFEFMRNLTLTSWPAHEAEVEAHLIKCKATFGHLTKARALLEEAGSEESKTRILAMQTVELDLAIRLRRNDKVADLVVKHREEPNGGIENGLPFVCLAAAANNPDGLDLLISRGAEVNATDSEGNTPVHHAVLSRAHGALRKLAEYRRVNPNKKNNHDRTPLHETVTALKDVPQRPRIRSAWKSSRALAISTTISTVTKRESFARHIDSLQILLKSFSKLIPNLPTGTLAQTALHLAAEAGNTEAVVGLLQHPKIEANLLDKRGRTPLLAGIWRMQSVAELIQCEMVDVNVLLADKGWSPCHACIIKNNMRALSELLQSPRVDLTLEDHMGWTPLHLAIHENSLSGVEKLLQSPAMQNQQTGFHLCEMMRSANALRQSGDPSGTGIWDQATPDVLERLPELLLGSRQWEFLHDVVCSIAFLSGVISNFGVDKASDMFEATVRAVRERAGVRPAIVSELERYREALESKRSDLRSRQMEISLVAFENSLWGVKAMKIAVEEVVNSMLDLGKQGRQLNQLTRLPSHSNPSHIAVTSKFFKIYNPLKRIDTLGLLRLVGNSGELPAAFDAIHEIFLNRDDIYIREEIDRILQEEASEKLPVQGHQRAVMQLASLLNVFCAREGTQAVKVLLDHPFDPSTEQEVRSQLCVAFLSVVESFSDAVHLRVLRLFGHFDKTVVILEVSNSPFHSAFLKDDDQIRIIIKRIKEGFESEDSRLQQCKDELKIESIVDSVPSVFLVLEILCPQSVVKRFQDQMEFESQLMIDILNACNIKPHLVRVVRVSCTWNAAIVEFLNETAWYKTERNYRFANKIVEDSAVQGSKLLRGVLTAHLVSACCVRSTVPPLLNGEWQHAQVHLAGVEPHMHNEVKFLENYILPALQLLSVDKRCYFTWNQILPDRDPAKVEAQLQTALARGKSDPTVNGIHFVATLLGQKMCMSEKGSDPQKEANAEKTASSITELITRQFFLKNPLSSHSFVLLRDPQLHFTLKEKLGEEADVLAAMSDEDGSEQRARLEQLRNDCFDHSNALCCQYSPGFVGFSYNLEQIKGSLRSSVDQLRRSHEILQKVEVHAHKDASYEMRKVLFQNKVTSNKLDVTRWRQLLKEQLEKSGGKDTSDDLLEDPSLSSILSEEELATGDVGDARALGVNLDVSWGMFQLGMAITDSLFSQLESVGSAPPYHSHLWNREQQHGLREETAARFCSCVGEPRELVLQELEQCLVLPPRQRVPLVILQGSKNSGRTTMLAKMASNLSVMPAGRTVADILVYHCRAGAPFSSLLRHLCLELALQSKGSEGLDTVPGLRGIEECLQILQEQIMAAQNLNQSVLLVVDHLDESEQVSLIKVILACYENGKDDRFATVQCVLTTDNAEKLAKLLQADTLSNVKEMGLAKVVKLKGLSKAEQAELFVNFTHRFRGKETTQDEIRVLEKKQDADNPLYLALVAHARVLRAGQANPLHLEAVPGTLAPMWKHLVLPNLAEACDMVPEVVESALRILASHP